MLLACGGGLDPPPAPRGRESSASATESAWGPPSPVRRLVSTSRSRSRSRTPRPGSLCAAVAESDALGAAKCLCLLHETVYLRVDATPLARNPDTAVSVHRVVGVRPAVDDTELPRALRATHREAIRAPPGGARLPSMKISTRMGPRRLAAKVFHNVARLERWVLMSPDLSRLEYICRHDTTSATRAFAEGAAMCGISVAHARRSLVAKRIASFVCDDELLGDEFLVESLTSLAVSRLTRHCPHLLGYEDAFVHGPSGRAYLLMHRADETLATYFNSLPRMPPEKVIVVLNVVAFQVAAALHTLQTRLQLKHHDLHGKNVFMSIIRRDCKVNGQPLHGANVLRYYLGGRNYYLPNIKINIMVADFGMASMTLGGRRVGRIDMGDFDGLPDWGPWNNHLEGAEGYDLQIFLGFLSSCGLGGAHHVAAEHGARLAKILAAPPLTKQGRPATSMATSRVTPLQFIEAAFSNAGPTRPVYDFTAVPTRESLRLDDPDAEPRIVTMMSDPAPPSPTSA